jgi:biotin-(acetyl-CoA carboxylase) ligase
MMMCMSLLQRGVAQSVLLLIDYEKPAGNIYASLVWQFQQGPASLSGLSLAIGVAVIKALEIHGIVGADLKWPNDIYWQQRKLGGILVEVSGEADGPAKDDDVYELVTARSCSISVATN